MDLTKPPTALRTIGMYTKTANEHDNRDPAVAYYCRLFAAQKGMELDRSSPESKAFLCALMDKLDASKLEHKDNEYIANEMVGQAHVEEYALKLLDFAYTKDASHDFGPATVKAFYTAGILLDVACVFGEVTGELEKARKYCKMKALYITQCKKTGETPVAGPLAGEGSEDAPDLTSLKLNGPSSSSICRPASPSNSQAISPTGFAYPPAMPPMQAPASATPTSVSTGQSAVMPVVPGTVLQFQEPDIATLDHIAYSKAEKCAKHACSALQYHDRTTAIRLLSEALTILHTGKP